MSINYLIQPEWNIIKNIKEAIENDRSIADLGRDFLDATRMVALELTENALKYSDRTHAVEISVNADTDECVIMVTNSTNNKEMLGILREILKRIQAENSFELYVERLKQLQERKDGYSRMGLYRIAYEGEFSLEGKFEGDTVTMIAKRSIKTA